MKDVLLCGVNNCNNKLVHPEKRDDFAASCLWTTGGQPVEEPGVL